MAAPGLYGAPTEQCYEPSGELRKARNRVALCFRLRVSARADGLIRACVMARRNSASSYLDFKLFHSVLRFCAKESLRNPTKPSPATPSFSICDATFSRSTVEDRKSVV